MRPRSPIIPWSAIVTLLPLLMFELLDGSDAVLEKHAALARGTPF
jgi:hypothetical protein